MGRRQSGDSARDRIRQFLDGCAEGDRFTAGQLQELAGISSFARRLRELRQEEGYQVFSYRDRSDLKQDEYCFMGKGEPSPVESKVPAALAKRLLAEIPYCQLCGRTDRAAVPGYPNRKVTLNVHHFRPRAREGGAEEKNLMVLCSYCNEGISKLTQISAFIQGDDLQAAVPRLINRQEKDRIWLMLGNWLNDNPDFRTGEQNP